MEFRTSIALLSLTAEKSSSLYATVPVSVVDKIDGEWIATIKKVADE